MTSAEVATELTNILTGEIRFLGFLAEGKQVPVLLQTILKQRKAFLDKQLEKLLTADLVKQQ